MFINIMMKYRNTDRHTVYVCVYFYIYYEFSNSMYKKAVYVLARPPSQVTAVIHNLIWPKVISSFQYLV